MRSSVSLASTLYLAIGLLASSPFWSSAQAAPSKPDSKAKISSKTRRVSQPTTGPRPSIDIVFAIDCSGSMGGVIETAKQKVWDIVNEAAKAKPTPQLRIGLLAYGNGSETYRKYDLSDDLDTVYGNLMTFKDEGWSSEYVGEAIQKTLDEMSWSGRRNRQPSLRSLYVVGNETAKQGPIDYATSAPRARGKSVFVNAIYCGSSGGQDTWQQFAALGGGKYLEIAGDGGSVMIATPYDGPIATLNTRLNGTYLPYGVRGERAARNQVAQDSNAAAAGGAYSSTSRAVAKSSAQYSNATWDLVDKSREAGFDLAKIPTSELPAAMQKMDLAQKRAFLKKKQDERAALQKQLQELGKKRATFVQAEIKKSGKKDSFNRAVSESFGAQAKAGGFGGFGAK